MLKFFSANLHDNDTRMGFRMLKFQCLSKNENLRKLANGVTTFPFSSNSSIFFQFLGIFHRPPPPIAIEKILQKTRPRQANLFRKRLQPMWLQLFNRIFVF